MRLLLLRFAALLTFFLRHTSASRFSRFTEAEGMLWESLLGANMKASVTSMYEFIL